MRRRGIGKGIVDDKLDVVVIVIVVTAHDETIVVGTLLPARVVEDELHVGLAHLEPGSSTRRLLRLLGQHERLLDVVVAHRVVVEEAREPHEVCIEDAELRFQVWAEVHLHLQVAVHADGLGLEDGLQGEREGGGEGETEEGGEILRFTRGMSFLCLRSDWIQARRVECVLSISIFFMLVILRGGWLLRRREWRE